MSDTFKFGLVGIGDNVQLGKRGPRVKVTPSGVQLRNAADNAMVRLQLAQAVGQDEAVTKQQLDDVVTGLAAALVYKGTFDASAGNYNALTNASLGDLYKVSIAGTVSGVAWEIGDILIVNKDVTGVPTASDVDKIDNTEASDILRTGDISTDPNFSVDGSKLTTRAAIKAFVESQVGAGDRFVALAFDSSTPLNIGAVAPSGSIAKRAYIYVSQAFNGSTESTLQLGTAGDTDAIVESKHIDLHQVGHYEVACNVKFNAPTQCIATYNRDSASQGAAEIVVELVSI